MDLGLGGLGFEHPSGRVDVLQDVIFNRERRQAAAFHETRGPAPRTDAGQP